MIALNDIPIKRKLTMLIMTIAGITLVTACSAFFIYELLSFQKELKDNLSTLADVIEPNCTAALDFEISAEGASALATLHLQPRIIAACIYQHEDRVFAKYTRTNEFENFSTQPQKDGFYFKRDGLVLFSGLILDGKRIGSLYLKSDYYVIRSRLNAYLLTTACIFIATCVLAFLISSRFQRVISNPILNLLQTAKTISLKGDYSLHAKQFGQDELGEFTEAFNDMLSQIEKQDKALRRTNNDLLAMNKELKETQAQLVQSEKLASIGILSAGIAHELNQPLAYIRSSAQLLIMDDPTDLETEEVIETLNRVEEGTSRMMKIISHLRSFARPTDLERHPIELHEVLENCLIFLSEQFRLQNIKVDMNIGLDIPCIQGNAYLLEQVFLNIMSNARDALEDQDDGVLKIQTDYRMQKKNSAHVAVSFIDNGVGIPKSQIPRIFDPFYTTKVKEKGTGLGLSISYGIIRDHAGAINVTSVVGEGTTFEIVFDSIPTEPVKQE